MSHLTKYLWYLRIQKFYSSLLTPGVLLSSTGLLTTGVYIDMTSFTSDDLGQDNCSSSSSVTVTPTDHDPPHILILYLTVGLMTGLGFGLTYLPIITIIKG